MQEWIQLTIALGVFFSGIVITVINARRTRQSQSQEAKITGENTLIQRYNELYAAYQKDREADAKEMQEVKKELEAQKKETGDLRRMFSGYRAYIHRLRGQIFDLGARPYEWPDDLEQ